MKLSPISGLLATPPAGARKAASLPGSHSGACIALAHKRGMRRWPSSTTSSWAPVRPAACWRTACQRGQPVQPCLLLEAGTEGRFDVDQHPGRVHQAAQQSEATTGISKASRSQMPLTGGSRSLGDKTLGGSSSINGMLYVRGNPLDYNTWSQFGNRGWGYDSVLPYFRKAEHFAPGGDESRGRGGPLNVEHMRERAELLDAFIDAAVDQGFHSQQGLQQRPTAGVRLLPGDPEERRAVVVRARLHRSDPQPAKI